MRRNLCFAFHRRPESHAKQINFNGIRIGEVRLIYDRTIALNICERMVVRQFAYNLHPSLSKHTTTMNDKSPRWIRNNSFRRKFYAMQRNSLARSRTSFGQFYSIRSGILMVEFIFRISNINVSAAINRIEPPFLFGLHECLLLDAGQYNDHKLKLTFD